MPSPSRTFDDVIRDVTALHELQEWQPGDPQSKGLSLRNDRFAGVDKRTCPFYCARPSYADRYGEPGLAEFTDKCPEVSIGLDTSMQVVEIVGEGYDLAVRT